MGSYIATLEDEENNRQIQFAVNYTANDGQVEIANVTPTQVSFLCPTTKTHQRSVRVHTDSGRNILAQYFHAKSDLERLALEIADQVQGTISALMVSFVGAVEWGSRFRFSRPGPQSH